MSKPPLAVHLTPSLPLPCRQEPLECLISFICSSNNNISRITGILQRLRAKLGTELCSVKGQPWHAFPTLPQLAATSEATYRQLGLGYRAKYVLGTAQKLQVCRFPPHTRVQALEVDTHTA